MFKKINGNSESRRLLYHIEKKQHLSEKDVVDITKFVTNFMSSVQSSTLVYVWLRSGKEGESFEDQNHFMTSPCLFFLFFFFSIWVLFQEHSRITGLQGKGLGIPLTPHYHFHPLYRNLDISRTITAESSPLHVASSRTRTRNLWFPIASR